MGHGRLDRAGGRGVGGELYRRESRAAILSSCSDGIVSRGSCRDFHGASVSCWLAVPAFQAWLRSGTRRFTGGDFWTFAYLGFLGWWSNQMCFTMGLRYNLRRSCRGDRGHGPIYTLVLAVLFRWKRPPGTKWWAWPSPLRAWRRWPRRTESRRNSPSLLGDAITMTGSLGFATYAVARQARGGEV